MMKLSASLVNQDILSLRTGGKIGKTLRFVINPNILKIEGWYIYNAYEKGDFVLLSNAVREIISKGLIVDDHDAMTPPEDLVRLKSVLDTQFDLMGKKVVTESRRTIGKVCDFAIDDKSFLINKIYINQNLFKSFSTQQLIVGRTQIIEITDKKIIVKDSSIPASARGRAAATA